jgi:hypothetical protein
METITHTPVDAGVNARLRVMVVAFTVRSAFEGPAGYNSLHGLTLQSSGPARASSASGSTRVLGFVQSPLVNTGFKKLKIHTFLIRVP